MSSTTAVIDPITYDSYSKMMFANAIEHSVPWMLLARAGRIKTIDGGNTACTWPVLASLPDVYDVTDYEDISAKFVPQKFHIQATLPWAEKCSTLTVSKGMLRQNTGPNILRRYVMDALPGSIKALLNQGNKSLAYDFFNSDGSSGTSNFQGLAAVAKFDTGLATSSIDASVTSGSTYAGKSLESGVVASEVDGVDVDNYAWTPRGINYSYASWDNAASDDGSTWLEALKYAQMEMSFDPSDPNQRPDAVICNKVVFRKIADQYQDQQRVIVNRTGKNDAEYGLGNSIERLYVNNMEIYWDVNAGGSSNTDQAWVLNFNQIEYDGLKPIKEFGGDDGSVLKVGTLDKKGVPMETDFQYNINRRGVLGVTTVPGQFKFNPRHVCLVKSYS